MKIEYAKEIDGGKTLLIGKPENGEFGFIDWFDGTSRKIEYLSINQYEHENRFYLFLLTKEFETLSDYLEDSVEDLKKLANQFFPNINIIWENLE